MKKFGKNIYVFIAFFLCFIMLHSFLWTASEVDHEHTYEACGHCNQVAQYEELLEKTTSLHGNCDIDNCIDCEEIRLLQTQLHLLTAPHHACTAKNCEVCEYLFAVLRSLRSIIQIICVAFVAVCIIFSLYNTAVSKESTWRSVTPVSLKVKITA